MPPQAPNDPFAEFVVAEDPFASFVASQQAAPPEQEPQGSGGASMTLGAMRAAPAAGRGVARFAANHPAGVQKAISVGMTGLGSSLGAGIGSVFSPLGAVPGALAGAAAKGLTPTQANIREWAGRGMGEAPDVAKAAGRAQGIQEYIKNTSGIKVDPAHILERAKGLPAGEAYTKSQGRELLKILGPDERVVLGPTAEAAPKAPGAAARLATQGGGAIRTGLRTAGKALSAVSGPMAMTDFAQTVEPNRTDIGVMGIGAQQPTPHGAELDQLNQRNIAAMQQRLQQQDGYRARILAALGLR
jgi:hypothetical protein